MSHAFRARALAGRRPAPWSVFLTLGALGAAGILLVSGAFALDLVNGAYTLLALAAILWGVRRHRPSSRWFWHWLAIGCGALVLGNGVMVYYDGIRRVPAPSPSLADLCYLTFYPCAIVALALLARRRAGGQERASRIDAAIIALGLALPLWVFVLAPTFADHTLPLAQRASNAVYPLMDVVLLGTTLRLLFLPGARPVSFLLLTLGAGCTLVTDSAYAVLSAHGAYGAGNPIGMGWLLSYTLLGAAALHPTMRALAEPQRVPPPRLTWGRLAPLVGAAALGPGLYALQVWRDAPISAGAVLAVSLALFLLAVARLVDLAGALRGSEAAFRQLFAANPHPMWVYRVPDLRVLEVNDAALAQYGYSRAEFERLALADLRPAEDRDRFLGEVVPGLRPYEGPRPHRHVRKDGSVIAVEVASHALDFRGEPARLVVAQDVTARRELERQLSHQAFHDPLTGLPNRALFLDRLAQARQRAGREPRPLAVLYLDLDRFKAVNDSLGHAAGDQLLVAVTARLERAVRGADTLARLGGDEFTVLLAPLADAGEAERVAARILEAFQVPFLVGGEALAVTTSVGVVVSAHGQDDPGELLRCADIALYRAKAAGKNRHVVFDMGMSATARERATLEADLRRALEREELALEYQPKVDLATGRLVGFEALARWPHPRRGYVSPGVFIPLAEETGLIQDLGRWVLRAACRQFRDWQAAYPQTGACRISVNLSAAQLYQGDIAAQVAEVLAETGLPAQSLQLEITETVLMDDAEATLAALRRLRDLGVHLAIDDFGTGYSSLSYLKRFPVDTVKIDKSFVQDLSADSEDTAIVLAVIGLARTLGLRVVAEGVETAEHLARLQVLGCEVGQGYYFARPLPVADAERLLAAPPAIAPPTPPTAPERTDLAPAPVPGA